MKCIQKAFFHLKAQLKKAVCDEAGQAVLEYTLVLVVVLAVCGGSLYQFNQAFRQWADNYFGEYLACLLETGELPSLGGAPGECNQSFQQFTMGEGRPSEHPPSSETDDETSSASPEKEAEDSSPSAALGDGGGGSNIVQVLRSPSLSRGRVTRFSAGQGDSDGGDGSGTNTGSAQITDLGDGSGGKIVRIPLRGVSGYSSYWGRNKDDDEKKDKFKTSQAKSGEGADEKTQTMIRIERKSAAAQEVEIEDFTFGKFLRMMIIAAIIIAILLFIGGQLLQVSKSMD